MPKKSSGSKSKRMTSATRHKIERKKRENKRDLRKAAKAMRKTGMRIRPKKQREQAKRILKISNSDPDKASLLEKLLRIRKAAKVSKSTDKSKKTTQQPSADDDGVVPPKPIATGASLEAADQAAEREAQKTQKQFLIVPATASHWEEFECVTEAMHQDLPTVIVTVDARAGSEGVAWNYISNVVAAACDRRVAELTQYKAATESAANGGSSKKRSRASTDTAAPPADDKRTAAVSDPVNVLFVLTRADLLPPSAMASAALAIGVAIQDRYQATLDDPESVLRDGADDEAPPSSKKASSTAAKKKNAQQQAPQAFPQPVRFHCLPFSPKIDASVQLIFQTLVANKREKGAPNAPNNNLGGKSGCVLVGMPNSGKTSLCRALTQTVGDSNVALVPAKSVRIAGDGDVDANRHIFPGAKSLTITTVTDDEMLRRSDVMAGAEVIFHPASTIDHIESIEAAAVLLVEQFVQPSALCQLFSLPLMDSAEAFLKALGRVILRDGGYIPGAVTLGSAGKLAASAVFASQVQGGALALASTKFRRVTIAKRDGRNAFKIGSRTLLQEFRSGEILRWCTSPPACFTGSAEEVATQVSEALRVFDPWLVKGVSAANGSTSKDAALVSTMDFATRTYRSLFPETAVEVKPAAFAGKQEPGGDDEADDENIDEHDDEEEEFDDEEEEDFDEEEDEA